MKAHFATKQEIDTGKVFKVEGGEVFELKVGMDGESARLKWYKARGKVARMVKQKEGVVIV